MLTKTGQKYPPIAEAIGRHRFVPSGVQCLLVGEFRVYESPVSPAECLARLEQHLTASQLRPGRFKAIGEVK